MRKPLVFEDPLAVRILGKEYAEEVKRTPDSVKRPFSAALRAFMVVRARLAEDVLAAGVRELGVAAVSGAGRGAGYVCVPESLCGCAGV